MSGFLAFVTGMFQDLIGSFSTASGEARGEDGAARVEAEAQGQAFANHEDSASGGWVEPANDNLAATYTAPAAPSDAPVLDAVSSTIAAWIEAGVIALGDLATPIGALQPLAEDQDVADTSLAHAFDALQRANALFEGGDQNVVIIETPFGDNHTGHNPWPFA